MEILGSFKYHIYEITLEGSSDETEYKVTCKTHALQDIREEKEGQVEIRPFKDLRMAREAFQNAVVNAVMRTSFSDVSIFHQRTCGIIF